MNYLPKRLLSIDVFRAVTMLLMIFVNDVSGVKNIPSWIEHVSADADGLGFADTIFPAFLFIVGLSLPFAIRNRMNKGDSFAMVASYILTRSLALIVMGFFHVNLEEYSSAALLPQAVWEIIITVSFFLIWLDYPRDFTKAKRYALMLLGVVLLVVMAFMYKGGDAKAPEGLKPSWWGILGIIGWSYLVCATIFLICRGNFVVLLTALILFIFINISSHTGFMHFQIPVIGDASSETLVMSGCIISVSYNILFLKGNYKKLWFSFAVIGVIAILAGLLIRPYADGISKIRSTPAWVLICTGISILVFDLMIYLVEYKKRHEWFNIIRPAGTSTLTVYLIPYLLYSIYSLINFHYPRIFNEGTLGIVRSFAVAFVVIFIASLLERKRIRLKI